MLQMEEGCSKGSALENPGDMPVLVFWGSAFRSHVLDVSFSRSRTENIVVPIKFEHRSQNLKLPIVTRNQGTASSEGSQVGLRDFR